MSKCTVYCYCSMDIDLNDDAIIEALATNDFFRLTQEAENKIKKKLEGSGINYEDIYTIYRNNIILWEE